MKYMMKVLPALLAGTLSAPFAAAQSLHLNEALALAERNNHDLKLAAIATDGADANVTIAAAAPNPVLSLSTMGYNPSVGIGPGSLRSKTVDSAVRVDQLIERGGKRRLRTAAAELQRDAARADQADTRRQLRRDVGAAYYDLLAAQERASITRESADLADSALKAAETRHKAGDLSGNDTARLRIDTLRTRNDADDAVAELDEARRALALLLSMDRSELLTAADAWPAAPSERVLDAEADAALDKRADVAAARARLDAAHASRDLAVAGKTRDITVGVQYDHYPTSAANPQGTGNTFGVAVQIPLFVRYGMQGEIRGAESALDAAGETLDKVRQAARADIGQARARAGAASARVTRYEDEILPAAKKSLDAGEFAFAHGAMGVMDVLDVRRNWRAAQLDASAAHADLAKSLAALTAALSRENKQ